MFRHMCVIMRVGVFVLVAALGGSNASLADNAPVTIKVILSQGKLVFDQPNVTIKVGQQITWVSTTGAAMHKLIPQGAGDAFTPTGDFDQSTTPPPSQTFNTAGVIHYKCFYHPATMKGTITVQ